MRSRKEAATPSIANTKRRSARTGTYRRRARRTEAAPSFPVASSSADATTCARATSIVRSIPWSASGATSDGRLRNCTEIWDEKIASS